MPPEYVANGQFSTKSDVYSFGVLILEIISGKKNSSFYQIEGLINNLVTYVSNYQLNNSQFFFNSLNLIDHSYKYITIIYTGLETLGE